MYFELVITRRAQIDLDEIFVWYEEHQSELGFSFIKAFEAALNKIALNPYYTPANIEEARSAFIKKFPYKVFYRIDENNGQVRIIAVLHQHRNPLWIKSRLNE